MNDFRMELHGVIAPRFIGYGGKGRALRNRNDFEALGQSRDAVAVAHPDGVALAGLPYAIEQRTLGDNLDLGAAKFAVVARFDTATELRHHGLFAIADAEHRKAGLEDALWGAGGVEFGNGGWAAGEDDALGAETLKGLFGLLRGDHLAIDALFADAAGDQLRHLRAEIDDENAVLAHWGIGGSWHDEGLSQSPPHRNRPVAASGAVYRISGNIRHGGPQMPKKGTEWDRDDGFAARHRELERLGYTPGDGGSLCRARPAADAGNRGGRAGHPLANPQAGPLGAGRDLSGRPRRFRRPGP
jgi:hypothetical protein